MPDNISREETSLLKYLDTLASVEPTPGGGSAAAVVAATGAALVSMVARINAANPKYVERFEFAAELTYRGDAARAELLRLRHEDEAAYASVVAAQALPRSTDLEKHARAVALQAALAHAAAVPLAIASAAGIARAAREGLDLDNPHVVSDLGCAAEFAAAAIGAAAYSVRINHAYLKDAELIARQAGALEAAEREGARDLEAVRAALRAKR